MAHHCFEHQCGEFVVLPVESVPAQVAAGPPFDEQALPEEHISLYCTGIQTPWRTEGRVVSLLLRPSSPYSHLPLDLVTNPPHPMPSSSPTPTVDAL